MKTVAAKLNQAHLTQSNQAILENRILMAP